MRLWIRWLIGALVGLVGILVIALAGIMYSTTGARWVWGIAQDQVPTLLPGAALSGAVDGQLAGPLVISELTYAAPNQNVTVGRLELDWRFTELWRGGLVSIDLLIREVDVQLSGASAESSEEAPPTDAPFTYPELPVDVAVQRLEVLGVQLLTEGATTPVVLQRVFARAGYSDNVFKLSTLQVDADNFNLATSAQLDNQPQHPFAFSGEFSYDPSTAPVVVGKLNASGTVLEAQIAGNVAAPYNLQLTGELKTLLDDPGAQVQLLIDRAPVGWLLDESNELPLSVAAQVEYGANRLQIAPSKITLAQTHLNVVGDVDLGIGALDLQSDWQNLRWPLVTASDGDADVVFHSDQGQFSLSGQLEAYVLELDGTVVLPDAEGVLTLQGQGSDQHLDVHTFRFDVLEGQLAGATQVRWAPELDVVFDMTGQGLNPETLVPDYPGRLNFTARGDLDRTTDVWRGQIAELNLSGALLDRPVMAQLQGSFTAADLASGLAGVVAQVSTLEAGWGEMNVRAQGELGQQSALDYSFTVPDLTDLQTDVQGSLIGHGQITGQIEDPVFGLSLEAQDIVHESLAEQTFNTELDLHGQLSSHEGQLGGTSDWGDFGLVLQGGWQEQAYFFTLQTLTVPLPDHAPLRLAEPLAGRFGADAQILESFCLAGGGLSLCAALQQDTDRQIGNIEMTAFPLALLAPLLPSGVALEGQMSAQGEVANWQRSDVPLSGQIGLTFDGVALAQVTQSVEEQETVEGQETAEEQAQRRALLSFAPSTMDVTLAPDVHTVNAQFPLEDQGGLSVTAQIQNEGSELTEQAIDGTVTFSLPNLAVIDALVEELENVAGQVEVKMAVAGTLGNPPSRVTPTSRHCKPRCQSSDCTYVTLLYRSNSPPQTA